MTRVNDALKKVTNRKITPFDALSIPFVSVFVKKFESNDCGFFVIMFLKYYDVDAHLHLT